MNSKVQAFSIEYDGIVNVLSSKVWLDSPYNPETMAPSHSGYEFDAVWDTGATNSVISHETVRSLCLQPITIREVVHGGGKEKCHVYLVSIRLPNQITIPYIQVLESNVMSCGVLIGMDIINQGDFAVSNHGNRTVFTFRTPSMARIDFSSAG